MQIHEQKKKWCHYFQPLVLGWFVAQQEVTGTRDKMMLGSGVAQDVLSAHEEGRDGDKDGDRSEKAT